MEDAPEIVKLLKYILFTFLLSNVIILSHALVTESPSIVPVPFYHSEEVRSDLIASFSGNREGFRNTPQVQRRQDDLDPDHTGGHKGIRQVPSRPPHSSDRRMLPPPHPHRRFSEHQESLGSLCSIFRTFLEPRRFHRCHVYNGEPSGHPPNHFDRDGPTDGSSNGPLHSNDLNHESPTRDGHLQQQQQIQQHHHNLQHHGRNIDGIQQRESHNGPKNGGPPPHDLRGPPPPPSMLPPQSIAEKRYDHHIDDIHLNHSGEEEDEDGHHLIHSGLPPSHHQDPTKISQDRTMIVVPERSCPPGQRRDPRGYCRRLVKIRTNYQYGHPPQGVVRPIPIRYYYSRIVAIPTLHFFFQNV